MPLKWLKTDWVSVCCIIKIDCVGATELRLRLLFEEEERKNTLRGDMQSFLKQICIENRPPSIHALKKFLRVTVTMLNDTLVIRMPAKSFNTLTGAMRRKDKKPCSILALLLTIYQCSIIIWLFLCQNNIDGGKVVEIDSAETCCFYRSTKKMINDLNLDPKIPTMRIKYKL